MSWEKRKMVIIFTNDANKIIAGWYSKCQVWKTYMKGIEITIVNCFIARPKGVPPKSACPKDGLFRLHASWIYISYAGFDYLAAILCH